MLHVVALAWCLVISKVISSLVFDQMPSQHISIEVQHDITRSDCLWLSLHKLCVLMLFRDLCNICANFKYQIVNMPEHACL